MHIRISPPFFGTNSTGLEQGDFGGLMNPFSEFSFNHFFSSSLSRWEWL
jgi:hypothetical protein